MKELADQYNLRGKGKWYTSYRFREVETAKSWGLTPSQWDELGEFDKAEMLAYESTLGLMKMYEEHLEEDRQVRNNALQSVKG